MDKVLLIDCTNGEVSEVNLSTKDLEQRKIDLEAGKEIDAVIAQQKTAKEALLTKLGITEDEAKLLLS